MGKRWLGWLVGGSIVAVAVSAASVAGLARGVRPVDEAHQQAALQQAQMRSDAIRRTSLAAKLTQTPPVGRPRLRLEAGILPGRTGPVSSDQFLVSNIWQSPVPGSGDTWYVVWAGISREPNGALTTPGLIVHTEKLTPDGMTTVDHDLGKFDDVGADGPLTITSAAGSVVTLRTPAGAVFQFNVATLSFE
jgi:hypothetical protein